MNRSRWSVVPAVVLSAGLFAACSSSSYSGSAATTTAAADTKAAATTTAVTKAPASTATAAAGATTAAAAGGGALTIKSFAFSPASLSAKAGTDIAVTNADSAEHTVSSDDGKTFNVDVKGNGTATIKGVAAGTYKYHCAIHPSMAGTLVVS